MTVSARRSPRRTAPSTTPVCHLTRGVLRVAGRRRRSPAARPWSRPRARRMGADALPLRDARRVTAAALVHVVVSGLATGSIYALMALSLVIIYNATRTLNFAQGEMLMVSTFVGWTAQRAVGLPLLVALLVAVLAAALLALVVRAAGHPARHRRHPLGRADHHAGTVADPARRRRHRVEPRRVSRSRRSSPTGPIALGPVRVAPASLGIIGASLVLMLALAALFRWTRLGRAMRAVAQNQRAARLMGISVERVYAGAVGAGRGGRRRRRRAGGAGRSSSRRRWGSS